MSSNANGYQQPPATAPALTTKDKNRDLPSYTELPLVFSMPRGCTWGLWDSDGKHDQLGTLNLLTPDVVLEAKKEILLGINIATN
jgi:hypothetical protein